MSRLAPSNITESLLDEARALSADFDRLSQAISERIGLRPAELLALDLISRGQPVTAGQLARELNLTTGAITSLIDRLDKAGFAKRAPDPSDRRRVFVVATPKEKQLQALFEPLDADLRQVLETYSEAELVRLVEFIRRVRLVVSGATDGLRSGTDRLRRRRSARRNSVAVPPKSIA